MNTNKNDRYLDDLEWAVESRALNQRQSLSLLRLLEKSYSAINADEKLARIWRLLAGASFSLWRAAPLSGVSDSVPMSLGTAKRFLEIVIRDNAINYVQDKSEKNWTAGYYINSAQYRLMHIQTIDPSLCEFSFMYENSRDTWMKVHTAIATVMARLSERLN